MAIEIDSINSLQNYLNGVMNRADHHAKEVEGVSLALLGAIIWRADGEILVREYNGNPANMIWFHIQNNKYVMTYNHNNQTIELKERTHTGTVITSFNNSTTYEEIIRIFSNL
ncbi:hypothetical protein [Flavobacterium oreochromis]|uniref:hypothetical protein n=1 Tax=Flavobacterium oreochromis TaxID=2906078 RepID=UPI000B4CF44C|nr:hypothetical protein [Flavobacterium oreochromis]OWP79045.1 hypothetical protein BWG23_00460 [Flavobacterium oreochromis]OWP79052.1 hypothetical protein BWG23_00500 [Flavobacterium oreochromis]